MPKKSDRPEHESAMSNLLPEVSLDEEDSDESKAANEESNSSTELQNSSATEEKNYSEASSESGSLEPELSDQGGASSSSESSPGSQSREDGGGADRGARENKDGRLSILPDKRPDLKKKLGPYVSKEIDDALEEAYLTLRRRFGGKASKSLIVEAALRYSLSDCLRRGEESEIASWMERVLESKES